MEIKMPNPKRAKSIKPLAKARKVIVTPMDRTDDRRDDP
jgi:hypothetical protein